MSESPEDLLAKANLLLRRHAQTRAAAQEAADVPVLTDLVAPEEDLAAELVTEVVAVVQSRLVEDLERRLTQHLVAEVQSSVAATLGDLRQDIANAVGDAVSHALARRNRK